MVSFTCLENDEVQTLTKFDEPLKTASEICSSNLISLPPNSPLKVAIIAMNFWKYSQLPVQDISGCLGLVTEDSIFKFQLDCGRDLMLKAKASDVMESPPLMIDWDQPVTREILELLYDTKCILVNKNGRMSRIITQMDILKEQK